MQEIREGNVGYGIRKFLQLVLVSLVVGGFLTLTGLAPLDLALGLKEFALSAADFAVSALGAAGSYIVAGAVFVVPLWLVIKAFGLVRK